MSCLSQWRAARNPEDTSPFDQAVQGRALGHSRPRMARRSPCPPVHGLAAPKTEVRKEILTASESSSLRDLPLYGYHAGPLARHRPNASLGQGKDHGPLSFQPTVLGNYTRRYLYRSLRRVWRPHFGAARCRMARSLRHRGSGRCLRNILGKLHQWITLFAGVASVACTGTLGHQEVVGGS